MVPWTLDGEFGGEHQLVTIENNQKAVKIIVKDNEKTAEIQEIIVKVSIFGKRCLQLIEDAI